MISPVRYLPSPSGRGKLISPRVNKRSGYYQYVKASFMAVMYYICADCGNAVQEIKVSRLWDRENRIGEYCDDCNNWNPEVVIAYR